MKSSKQKKTNASLKWPTMLSPVSDPKDPASKVPFVAATNLLSGNQSGLTDEEVAAIAVAVLQNPAEKSAEGSVSAWRLAGLLEGISNRL